MIEFEKWQEKREIKTIGYLNNSSAYKAGEKAGWRQALKWAKEMHSVSSEPRFDLNISKELGEC